jgi:U32 family peptidase
MTTKKRKDTALELLSPAGSYDSMMAAIQAGCDSVYFGVEQLNMRARSTNNFTVDDLEKIAELAKQHTIKTYLTVNTVLYDHDIKLMQQIVSKAKDTGINAVIASDHAAIAYAHRIKMPVHISTQANVSNIETVEFYSAFAQVVVLARELTLSQVKQITQEIERRKITGPDGELMRIEIFGHGALCMAVSGKCYLSLHSHFASANRGACIQNCRRNYIVTDKEDGIEFEIDNEYIMSAKDLCTIDFLDKIIESGAQVLKIEGRGRPADYVHTVTTCYREAINAIKENTYAPEKISEWKERLSRVFNRGFWDGYYLGRTMGEWSNVYGSKATRKKIYIGKGVKYYDKAEVAEFLAENHGLKTGDKIMVTGPATGYVESTIEEMRVNRSKVEAVKKGEQFTIKLGVRIRASDKIYKLTANE